MPYFIAFRSRRMQMQHGRNDREVVVDPVIDFLDQQLNRTGFSGGSKP
jgi:hypothetical protein